jgi:hypothetical protein
MAVIHHHEPDRGRDIALVGLVFVLAGIIAVAIPCLKFCVDYAFRLVS